MRLLLASAAVIAASCGSGGEAERALGVDVASGDGSIRLGEVWTRPTAPGAESTAFYLTITNDSDVPDRVVSVESPRCGMAELHMSSDAGGGVMSMSPAEPDDLDIAPDGSLILEPGGLHIMCMGLTDPVVEGDAVELTIGFEQAGPLTAQAAVENR
jgi:copper(I)-binding protein